MREAGPMIKLMERGLITTKKDHLIPVNGLKTSNMVLVSSNGSIIQNMKVAITWA